MSTSLPHNLNSLDISIRLLMGMDQVQKEVYADLLYEFVDRIRLSSPEEDKIFKTDFFLDNLPCSIKGRVDKEYGGDDLLNEIGGNKQQSYSGRHDLMVSGRDARKYYRIFGRNKHGTYIRDFCGAFVYDSECKVVEEYNRFDDILKRPGGTFTSSLGYDGWYCQLQSFIDKRDDYLKVCCFIPEEYAKHCKALGKNIPCR